MTATDLRSHVTRNKLEDFEFLIETGSSRAAAAERVGMPLPSIARHYHRAGQEMPGADA